MYHSTATLLPDGKLSTLHELINRNLTFFFLGSVLVSGSNPHPDYSPNKKYPTEYRVERFYPLYYNKRRPEPSGVPTQISYGGSYFELHLSSDDLFGNIGNVNTVKVVLMKTGFSTHAINFGMRMAELDRTFTDNGDGTVTLHVSQAPPNPAILPPGTCCESVVEQSEDH
jgi:hypothetical protein